MSIIFEKHIQETTEKLRDGNLVLFPSDTIWGLSAILTDKSQVDRIYAIKKRPKNQSLILLVSDIEMLKGYVLDIHPRIQTMLHFHNRPLTIIYNKPSPLVPEYLLAGDKTIAIRVVTNQFCKSVIHDLDQAIISTSANIHGDPNPSSFEEINQEIKDQVDYIVSESCAPTPTDQASQIAMYNKKGELEFIRT